MCIMYIHMHIYKYTYKIENVKKNKYSKKNRF